MKKLLAFATAAICLTVSAQQPWMDTSLSFHERAKLMVAKMTLDQKINQIGHVTSAVSSVGLPG
ncbi:MAG: hypothetical protein K2N91_08455, partial [Muribaculaceae bacterium]|nr:hypothetical protein [Muribaculaceae bacterium]